MPFKGRHHSQIRTKCKNVHIASRPEFHVLSNGALASAVSRILCTGKRIKLFTETVLAVNLHFQQLDLHLVENKVHHSKERLILV
jgi:hypothetical protein